MVLALAAYFFSAAGPFHPRHHGSLSRPAFSLLRRNLPFCGTSPTLMLHPDRDAEPSTCNSGDPTF